MVATTDNNMQAEDMIHALASHIRNLQTQLQDAEKDRALAVERLEDEKRDREIAVLVQEITAMELEALKDSCRCGHGWT